MGRFLDAERFNYVSYALYRPVNQKSKMLSRRNFVKAAGIPLVMQSAWLGSSQQPEDSGPETDKAPPIKRFTVFQATGNHHRFVGMNAYDTAPKGISGARSLVKVELADGTYGIGPVGYRQADEKALAKVKALIGKDPFTFYSWKDGKITGVVDAMKEYFFDARYAWFESAVLDAIGKLKKQPVWSISGTAARDGVDPYDGTLYFEEIANNRDIGIIGELAQKSKADGYRGIKIKLGRPSKWLPGEAGVQRDIDAFIALREAVGSNFVLMADANNGYAKQLEWAIKLLTSCAPYQMYFIEELFPDDAAEYRKLREALLQNNFFIPIADGENINDLALFDPYMQDGVYNYLQPDMHTCGYSNIVAMARRAEDFPHVKVIPHVWQSHLGLIMSLHAAKICRNVPYVEDSRYFEHAVTSTGYIFRDGQWFIPANAGWGIDLAPDYKKYVVGEEIVVS